MKTGFYAREFNIIPGPHGNMVQLAPIDSDALVMMDMQPEELIFDKQGLLTQIRKTEEELTLEMPSGASISQHPDIQTLETAYNALTR